jgi:hypothetical protein
MYRAGMSSKDIGKRFGFSRACIDRQLRLAGEKKRSCHSGVITADIVAMYQAGTSADRIAEHFALNKKAIQARLKVAGVRMRKQTDYAMPSGPQSHLWKGGRFTNSRDGYVVRTVDKRRILEHRYVMECALGRSLKPSEYVHHLNGVRDDNRPENLALTTAKTHESRTFMKVLQARIRELEQQFQHYSPLACASGTRSIR